MLKVNRLIDTILKSAATCNGFHVIKGSVKYVLSDVADGAFVALHRPAYYGKKYVTYFFNATTPGFYYGKSFDTEDEAVKDSLHREFAVTTQLAA